MRYSLRQLEYFIAAGETLSITLAAERIHISQPSISTAISFLEKELGVQLFIRHHAQGLSLTPAGRDLLREAKNLVAQAERLYVFASETSSKIRGTLSLGCMVTLAPMLVPELSVAENIFLGNEITLPGGRMTPRSALLFASAGALCGTLYLGSAANRLLAPVAGAVAVATVLRLRRSPKVAVLAPQRPGIELVDARTRVAHRVSPASCAATRTRTRLRRRLGLLRATSGSSPAGLAGTSSATRSRGVDSVRSSSGGSSIQQGSTWVMSATRRSRFRSSHRSS